MKTSYLQQIALIAIILFVGGCSPDNGGGGTTFIPGFNATWPVEGDENYEIDLQPNEENKNVHSGVFTGKEIHSTDDERDDNPLSGSFKGLSIEFTIKRKNGTNVKYEGEMTPTSETNHFIIKITLNSSQEGSLVLSR